MDVTGGPGSRWRSARQWIGPPAIPAVVRVQQAYDHRRDGPVQDSNLPNADRYEQPSSNALPLTARCRGSVGSWHDQDRKVHDQSLVENVEEELAHRDTRRSCS